MLKFWYRPLNSLSTLLTHLWNQSKTIPESQSNPALPLKSLLRVSLPLTAQLCLINLLPTLKPYHLPCLTMRKESIVKVPSSISFLPPTLDWSLWHSTAVWAHIHLCCRCWHQSAECSRARSQIQLATANESKTSKTCCVEWSKLLWRRLETRSMMSLERN